MIIHISKIRRAANLTLFRALVLAALLPFLPSRRAGYVIPRRRDSSIFPSIPTTCRPCQCSPIWRTMLRTHLTRTPQRPLASYFSTMAQRRIVNPAIFVCDLQDKFRPAIHEFPRVIATTQKVLKASQILNIPIFATTQNQARLGPTCPELGLDTPGGIKTLVHADKTLFSMLTPEVRRGIASLKPNLSCVIVGIESHICVTQTALDLLDQGHKVYVLADGVSSCNKEEVPIALARLRHEGAIVTTSESWLYECVGDAGIPEFKEIIALVRESSPTTKDVLQTLCKI